MDKEITVEDIKEIFEKAKGNFALSCFLQHELTSDLLSLGGEFYSDPTLPEEYKMEYKKLITLKTHSSKPEEVYEALQNIKLRKGLRIPPKYEKEINCSLDFYISRIYNIIKEKQGNRLFDDFSNPFFNSFFLEKLSYNLIYNFEQDILTRENYCSFVLMPLLDNIKDHALNEENNIYNRELLIHNIKVNIYFEDIIEKTGKQEVKISISDNGYGIRPEILKNIFQKGVSTKKDKENEHGIALWAAKFFVEKNNGTMSIESILGESTTVNFTIPYEEKIGRFYFQYKELINS